jgi:hypothetical protein
VGVRWLTFGALSGQHPHPARNGKVRMTTMNRQRGMEGGILFLWLALCGAKGI